jgi:hypothetical protein
MTGDFEDQFDVMPEPTAATSTSSAAALTFADFVAYAPSRMCIYLPCKAPWPNASVDKRLPAQPLLDASGNPVLNSKGKVVLIPASEWLEKNQSVEAMTWAPGEPEFVRDRLAVDGGWVPKAGVTTLNIYRPPTLDLGDATQATRWIEHWHAIYPDDADHIIAWLASRVQHPEIKINHALLLGGAPKIGKDTLLEPIITAVGAWNFRDITLAGLISKNNEFLRGVVVRVSEARDMGEQGRVDRYGLYDHTKTMLAAPPHTLRVNEKYLREYYIFNCFGMVVTTNHRDALYLPPDDRRHYVAFSERKTEDFTEKFWRDFWGWYKNEDGIKHVVAFLHQYDLTGFDPKASPPKTPAFWHMVSADRGETHGELIDAIDELGFPPALTINQLIEKAPGLECLQDRKMRRAIRKRLEEAGYLVTENPNADSGLWLIKKKRQMIYARADWSQSRRLEAARALQAKLNTQ